MKKKFLLAAVFLHSMLLVFAQDSIVSRVILIGDAGEMNPQQMKALNHAANHILAGKTTVIYLGDNVYPHGMGLPGSKEEIITQEILKSQYGPMRAKGAPVYFIPGNHDWDKSGPRGLAKIKRQWQYLDEQGDSLLKLVPANGCPDPYEIDISDSLVVIVFDSEWWLFPFDKTNTGAECSCTTKKDVLTRLDQLRYKNRHKVILLASHHPFQSYGVHGGRFTLKDHIFPLTSVKKNLYIPLPIIGSLYPFLRSTFVNPEDLKHPLYKDMIKSMDAVFDSFPNLIHVAGHEHGLQFIKGSQVQVVSGAGAKHTNASQGKNSLFADATQGYVTADLLTGNTMRFTYYIYTKDSVEQAFTYALPYTAVVDKELTALSGTTNDSVTVQVHPVYNKTSGIHRFFFGENYRREWAAPVTLPVLRLSAIQGGLTPLQLGGGMQSTSLRLQDKTGKEWVIRSVEKSPDALLPVALKQTFARDWLDDATSAQHPFAALIVPPIATAVHVPHANPVIGVVGADKNLGAYGRRFTNLVVVLEEREPLGNSDNSEKMKKNLQKDNNNKLHADEFLRARMLDALLGDWDRHEDQWRWYADSGTKKKEYTAVPRDRDQVFHVNQGLIPKLGAVQYVLPTVRNFGENFTQIKWLLFKTRFVNAYPEFQFSRDQWTSQARQFTQQLTDSVFETALQRLPAAIYNIRHDVLLRKLKARRDKLPAAMDVYYRFIQKVADIRVSDKNELVQVTDAPGNALNVTIYKLNKKGDAKEELMNKTYDPALTKEIRIYLGAGNDSVALNNKTSSIKLRIIGGDDEKSYNVIAAKYKVRLYDKPNGSHYYGDSTQLKRIIANDTSITKFTPVNLYNVWMPLALVGSNADDGIILGAGFRFIKQEGFRKTPYASMQQLIATHSFSTRAYSVHYTGDWIHAFGTTDFTINAVAKAPNNTINFFGRGNETEFDKTGNYKKFYRTRFNLYQLDPALKWRGEKGSVTTFGPSLNYYRFDADDNAGRFINNTGQVGSYDSTTINQPKLHLGVVLNYLNDKRNNKIIPQWGTYLNVRLQAYDGVSHYAKSFAQIIPEVALYKSLNEKSSVILAERFGGTVSIGKTAFYQSAFIGGQGNLLGYRQYRFGGQYSFYNNLEMRIKLADVASYIVPGQFGLIGFYDVGRVWETKDLSQQWHNGVGGGIYFAPASMAVFNFVMGHSTEGWYPYFTLGFRF